MRILDTLRRKAIFTITGKATDSGFHLRVSKEKSTTPVIISVPYASPSKDPGERDDLLIFLLVYSALLQPLVLIESLSIFIYTALFRRELTRWHACEHKSAALLQSGREFTLENLRQCPKVHPKCGSVWLMTAMEIFTFPWLLIVSHTVGLSLPPALYWLGTALSLSSTLLFCILSGYGRKWRKYLLPLCAPALILPLLIERVFLVREPPDHQLNLVLQHLLFYKDRIEALRRAS